MTFQNMCSIFDCTHEESLALWDYLMFLRVKDMLRQPPMPAITEEDMEFEKSREATPLTTQRYVEELIQSKHASDAAAPTLDGGSAQIREALKKEKATALAFKLTGEPPYPPSLREAERNKYMQAHIDSWKNSVIAHSKEYDISRGISPIDLQMIRCDRCNAELHFGRVPDGTDIVCHSCGHMTKFKSEGDDLAERIVGVQRRAAGRLFAEGVKCVFCERCKVELNFCTSHSRADVICYACGCINQYIDVVAEEEE